MRARDLALPLCCAVQVLAARAARAQEPDSVGFHRGQWGADFLIASGFSGAGAIHFSSATRAQVVDIGGDYGHTSQNQPGFSVTGDFADVSLRLGIRSYHAMDRRLYRWTTIGVSANYNRQSTTFQDTVTTKTAGGGGGLFANLGATWLVAPHLGIGALWEIRANYSHFTSRGPNGSQTNETLSMSFGRVALAGQIYF